MTYNMEEEHFCRCCLSKECFKDMKNTYYFINKTENYFEMLKDTFNVEIPNNDTERCLICEECVSKIRGASAFKKQVLNVQEIIKNRLNCEVDTDNLLDPKIEDGHDDFVDFTDDLSDSLTDKDFMWDSCNKSGKQKGQVFVIELGSKKAVDVTKNTAPNSRSNTKRNKRAYQDESPANTPINSKSTCKRRTLISSKRTKTNHAKTEFRTEKASTRENSDDCIQNASDTCNDSSINNSKEDDNDQNSVLVPKKTQTKRQNKTETATAQQSKEKSNSSKSNEQSDSDIFSHSKRKRENTVQLIFNSNLCLFRSFQNKFGCNFCKVKFPIFSQLREHVTNHTFTARSLNNKLSRLRGLSFKNAEISDLKCNLCSENLTDLTELTTHLKNNHDISFHGTEHYLVPYKLQNGFQCVLCGFKFNSYLRLSVHMNTHYANNVCEICGQSFINRLGLRGHVQSMHTKKKCSFCPEVFLTNSAKVKHLRKAHNINNTKRYCNLCDKSFQYTYILDAHKISEHGFKKHVFSCEICGKTFLKVGNLKIHLRSVHIKERNHPCSICGRRFFTTCDQKRHERTHEDTRYFACRYCDCRFKSKSTWRRHAMKQHGHIFGETSYIEIKETDPL